MNYIVLVHLTFLIIDKGGSRILRRKGRGREKVPTYDFGNCFKKPPKIKIILISGKGST